MRKAIYSFSSELGSLGLAGSWERGYDTLDTLINNGFIGLGCKVLGSIANTRKSEGERGMEEGKRERGRERKGGGGRKRGRGERRKGGVMER